MGRVDTKTFLTIVNLLLDDHTTAEQIDPSLSVEALVSYLQNSHSYFLDFRLPLIRRLFTDRLYSAGEGKLALTILQALWWALKAVVGKVLYLAVCLLISAFLALEGPQDMLRPENLGPFCWTFLWFSFLIGTMLQPHAVAPSQLKYICVRMMALDAKRYQMITGLGHHLAAFAGFTPFLMLITALLRSRPSSSWRRAS